MSVLDWISAALIIAGAALGALGGIGLVRLPDVFGRMHAATKPPTLGLVLVVVGASLRIEDASDLGLLGLVVMLQFLTAPVGAHLVGRAAYDSGGQLDDETVRDDLATYDAEHGPDEVPSETPDDAPDADGGQPRE